MSANVKSKATPLTLRNKNKANSFYFSTHSRMLINKGVYFILSEIPQN